MILYNPFDWYWIVGDDKTKLWSSKSATYVSYFDTDNVTTIKSEDELEEVLKVFGLRGPKQHLENLQPYQFFAMLELSGQKDNLNNFIASLPSPQNVIAKAKLEHTLYFEREDPIVLQAQAALGISDETLDALWTQALTF